MFEMGLSPQQTLSKHSELRGNSYPQFYPQSYPHVDSQQRARACRQHKPFEQMFERLP